MNTSTYTYTHTDTQLFANELDYGAQMIIIALDNVDNDVLITLTTVPPWRQWWQCYDSIIALLQLCTHILSSAVDDIKRFWFALHLHIVISGVVFGAAVVIMFILQSNSGDVNTLTSSNAYTYIHIRRALQVYHLLLLLLYQLVNSACGVGAFADLQPKKTADSSFSVAYQSIFHTLLRTQFVESSLLIVVLLRCPLDISHLKASPSLYMLIYIINMQRAVCYVLIINICGRILHNEQYSTYDSLIYLTGTKH